MDWIKPILSPGPRDVLPPHTRRTMPLQPSAAITPQTTPHAFERRLKNDRRQRNVSVAVDRRATDRRHRQKRGQQWRDTYQQTHDSQQGLRRSKRGLMAKSSARQALFSKQNPRSKGLFLDEHI